MAMIKCNECKTEISDKAVKCPNCGCPNEAKVVCNECGNEVSSKASICPKCGCSINNLNGNNKSKIVAGILGILLGGIGVHNFYLGYTGKAVTQLLLCILSCGLFSPITYIWGLIEGIMILTGSISEDANGNQLAD